MLENHIYHSTSSNTSFPQLYARVANSPNTPLAFPNGPQTLPTHTRAPHINYVLYPLQTTITLDLILASLLNLLFNT